jgi:hypothetical protein
MNLPLNTHYTNLQKRLGYLKILTCVADRFPLARNTLVKRLSSLLGQKTQQSDRTYLKQLLIGAGFPQEEEDEDAYTNVSKKTKQPENTLAQESIDLAQSLGILSKDNFLLENAMPLYAMIGEENRNAVMESNTRYNALLLDPENNSKMEHTYFLITLLLKDLPIAIIPQICLSRKPFFFLKSDFLQTETEGGLKKIRTPYSESNMLLEVFRELDSVIEKNTMLGEIENYKEWQEYFEGKKQRGGFQTEIRMGKLVSFRHHMTPRLEFLVDLDIIARLEIEQRPANELYWYRVTDTTLSYAKYLAEHFFSGYNKLDIEYFVRHKAFDFASHIYDIDTRKADNDNEIFKWFMRAYKVITRDIGNTPAWSISLLGCLYAQEAGVCIEIAEMYRVATEMGKKYSTFLRYSGGSGFDEEFLIKIDPKLYKELGIDEIEN